MYVVTGATGQLGRLVVEGLLATVPAGEVKVVVRDAAKVAEWTEQGVRVHEADYGRPESLAGAFAAGDRVLLISGNEFGSRVAQHGAVIDAAKAAGVALLAYTSVLGAPTATFRIAEEHQGTEELLRASGVPFALLRNGWYTENYTAGAGAAVAAGEVFGSSGAGRVATAPRRDYADAAVAVLTGEGHENRVYELSGDADWSMDEFAAELAAASGSPVVYRDVEPAEQVRRLVAAGLPEGFAALFPDTDAAVLKGQLGLRTGDLSRLIGRPTVPLAESVRAALGA
ncbi:SDR family oxidoreductase [Kitasatospora sp. NPDC089797]|uniref:SDR family oxidoreductase n=1 Tax=Kitasatospora sp. NPDC089797 TaxID=3155298 RepID=UPI0034453171